MPQSQNLKIIFYNFLACIFSSVRATLLCTLSLRGPCIRKKQNRSQWLRLDASFMSWNLFFGKLTFKTSFKSYIATKLLLFFWPRESWMVLKANVSQEILNWHSLRHSHSAEICIHFYCLSWLRQARQRKMIQNSALWLCLRLCQFKISWDT